MWFEIMKKSLKKQRSIHLILLFFVILSTMFLAASINNIHLVLNGVNTYMEYANAADIALIFLEEERDDVMHWVESREEVTECSLESLCVMEPEDILVIGDKGEEPIVNNRSMICLGHTGGTLTKPLDMDGGDLVLEEGQVALAALTLRENDLREGDLVKIRIAGREFTYTIVECKDILYGNSMNGTDRFLFTESDYAKMTEGADNNMLLTLYLNSSSPDDTWHSMEEQEFRTLMMTVRRSIYTLLYVFDMVVAGLLIAIGICLILISLLILRFSIVFTLEESYQEIGLMKALGMRDLSIQTIYLLKYLAIVVTGAAIGFAGSIPAGSLMLASVGESMMLGKVSGGLGINFRCSVLIVLFVLGMCLMFTGKLKKVSAITAIRGNETGERYGRKKGLMLHTKRRMGTIVFLGLNDVLCNLKQYMILLLTFCISFVLITIPLNTLTTMQSDAMAEKFKLNPRSAVYMAEDEVGNVNRQSVSELQRMLEDRQEELREKGYEATLSVEAMFNLTWTKEDGSMKVKVFSMYPIGNTDYQVYDRGVAPFLENEVAVSGQIMQQYDLRIGDTICAVIDGEEKEFLIVGVYTDYMQMGKSIRLNPALDMTGEMLVGSWEVMVDMDTELSQQQVKELFDEEFPEYDWITAQDVVDSNVGTVKDVMAAMQLPLTGMLCLLIMLIDLFMLKLIIIREKGQIAMLKSIGFTGGRIRAWITMRMVWVALLSMIFSVPMSMLSNRFVLTPLFGIMGASLKIQVNPVQAYLIYPGILLLGIVTATVFATRDVNKITSRDMKNAE